MTDRTIGILALRAQGLSLTQIAARMSWSRRTVIRELGIAADLLGARNGYQAVHLATRAGMI